MSKLDPKLIFFCGIILAASSLFSPSLALIGGIAFGLLLAHPYAAESSRLSHILLQASVVGLGFGMNLGTVLRTGESGVLYTAGGIALALAVGLGLGKLLRIGQKSSLLISCGTAICGGSAIAAIAPLILADEGEVGVSLATIFTLNAAALLLFPLVGHLLSLTQAQFGLWSALAIQDTSSVVGATAKYGAEALAIGTTVKLTRALWILPVALTVAAVTRSKARVSVPWFILLFVLAALTRTLAPQFAPAYKGLVQLGTAGLSVTLFLIGTSLSRERLRAVGWRPMLQGVLLWAVVASTSLWAIRTGVIVLPALH